MKIISHLIFILCCFWNVVNAAERDIFRQEYRELRYKDGCLESTEEDWRRVCGGMVRPPQESLTLSAGTVDTSAVAVESLPNSWTLDRTPAKDQRYVGSCATFAIVACLEYLVPGLRVSEAELYLRMVTFGRSSREDKGTCMHNYIPLLREGVVEESSFVPYEDYGNYVWERWCRSRPGYREDLAYYEATRTYRFRSLNVKDPDNDELPICGERDKGACNLVFNGRHTPPLAKEDQTATSEDFKESVEDLIQYTRRTSLRSLPVSMKPVWKTGMFPIKYRGLVECEYRDGYWRDQRFNCFPLMVGSVDSRDRSIPMSDSAFYLLRRILLTAPIVVSIPSTEKFKNFKGRGVIDLSPSDVSNPNKRHAICLWGYDNSLRAFLIKNSYDPEVWGDNG